MPHWRLVLGVELAVAAVAAMLGAWGFSVLLLLGAASTFSAAQRQAPPSGGFQLAVITALGLCGAVALALTIAGVLRRDALSIVLLTVLVVASFRGARNVRRVARGEPPPQRRWLPAWIRWLLD